MVPCKRRLPRVPAASRAKRSAHTRKERTAEQARLREAADGGAAVQGVVAEGFDGVEHRKPAATEQLDIHAQVCGDTRSERSAFAKQSSRARQQILHERDVASVEAPRNDFFLRKPVRRGHI